MENKHNIVKIIRECAKYNVESIKIDGVEIKFRKTDKEEVFEEAQVRPDPEFDKEAIEGQKEIDEFDQIIEEDNDKLDNFEDHEQRAILAAIKGN